jgi:phosphoribosyl 1,2-cyclic phosphate phosphodiesterase
VTVDGLNILIDTGPDLRMQLLRAGVTRLDAVLYTHEHRDHTAGLDDVRPINFLMKQTLNLYGLPRVMRALQREFTYAFAEHKYPGVPTIALNPVQPEPFFIKDIEIQPIRVRHMTLPILGYRIQNFAYITDGSFISTKELKKLSGVEVLVINALRKEEHYSHFSLEQALNIIREVGPQRAYLTHISHEMGLYTEVAPTLPDNVFLGIDNEVIEV